MVWLPVASLSSFLLSSFQTCTVHIFLLAKERLMSLCQCTSNADTWWASPCSPACSQQLAAALIAYLLLVTTEKPAPEVCFQSFSKNGSAITICLQNRSCIFKVWEIMTIIAHSETGSGFPYTKSLAHLLSHRHPLVHCSSAVHVLANETHFPFCLSQWEKYQASSLILYQLQQI